MLCESFSVEGIPILQVQFFRQRRQSLLVASPAVAALQAAAAAGADAAWDAGEGDLDFVLYDAKADLPAARERTVDYQFLSARPMPPRRAGESPAQRARALRRWMEACYLHCSCDRLGASLRAAASPLAGEYNALLSAVTAPGGRRVSGIVAQATDGGSVVALVVPLLGARDEDVRRTLTETSMLYAKALRCPWDPKTHSIVTAEFDLHLRLHSPRGAAAVVANGDGGRNRHGHGSPSIVLAERLSVNMADSSGTDASFVPLLQSCLNLRTLPQCSASYERGEGFAGYLPRLEAALYSALREPLHFLKLSVALSASFGEPIDTTAAVHDLGSGSRGPAQMQGASYCVMDKASGCSFMISLHYYGGTKLPSVGVICSQYLSRSHESLLRMKISYPRDAEQKLTLNADGMFDVAALSSVIATSAMETMAFLLTLCQ